MTNGVPGEGINPFYAIMPKWFLLPGIVIATAAAIIASQAIISGSFTIIKEAVSLNFWPKVRVLNPTQIRGQVYIPFVNWYLWIACSISGDIFQRVCKYGGSIWTCYNHYRNDDYISSDILSVSERSESQAVVLLIFWSI